MKKIELSGADLTIDGLFEIATANTDVRVELASAARARMQASRQYILKEMESGEAIYGVNTGFGAFSSVRISDAEIEKLQVNLIRSHCCGIGQPFSPTETRAIMCLRANALATGYSGIRPEVVDTILAFLNAGVLPVIPSQGSVGASGDLAPLSHLALALIGEGDVWSAAHVKQSSYEQSWSGGATNNSSEKPTEKASVAIARAGLTPLKLQAKEGLSLINGCQVMTGVGMLKAYEARRLAWMTDLAGSMSLEALRGTRSAFDPIIFSVRQHPGEAKTARNILKILGETSPIADSHENCNRVQDAYSLRCMPAVHGAAKDTLRQGIRTLEIEANSATDNPLVFAADGKILSCGNFHGEPVAFALDFMGIAMSAMASISECRIEKLINPSMSGLPAFLAPHGGLNSGHMIVQVAAAALVSENKILAHPASVDSIPTSADKEDHVSMGTIAARKLGQIVNNAENIIAMELLSASQALDMLLPLKPAGVVAKALEVIRTEVPFAAEDRVFANDIEKIKAMIRDHRLLKAVTQSVGELEW